MLACVLFIEGLRHGASSPCYLNEATRFLCHWETAYLAEIVKYKNVSQMRPRFAGKIGNSHLGRSGRPNSIVTDQMAGSSILLSRPEKELVLKSMSSLGFPLINRNTSIRALDGPAAHAAFGEVCAALA